jgi:AraC family transcriptional regulator
MQLQQGQFFGDYQKRREVFGMSIAELTPTVPEHAVETHTHTDAHFLLVLDGAYLSSARDMPAICTDVALIMNPPGTHHRDCFRGSCGRFMTVSMSGLDWRMAVKELTISQHALRLGASGVLSAYRIWQELQQWDTASALAIEAETHALFAEASIVSKECDGLGPQWLRRSRECLRDACVETPRLSDLAAAADVHPVYFSRAFRNRYGCSPGEYLRRCRLEKASALLRDQRLSLAHIATQCGFTDQSHFNHSFRQVFRISPGQFRVMASRSAIVQCVQDARRSLC